MEKISEHLKNKSTNLGVDKKRRDFLKNSALATGGFVVGFYVDALGKWNDVLAEIAQQVPSVAAAVASPAPSPVPQYPPNAFIKIAPDNSITMVINKLEMGQGVNTSMAQLIAEELECDWKDIKSVSAPVNPVYNHTHMPMQLTGGSNALSSSYDQHRRIGAAMKQMLIGAAALKWDVPAKQCRAENGFVLHPKKGKFSYGELADDANKQEYPADVTLKDPKHFKVIGKSVPRVDAVDKSTGAGIYGIDVRIPGMKFAVIARPPVRGSKLAGVKDAAAKSTPGVSEVVRFGESVAVLADNTWNAKKGRDALELTWDKQGKDDISDDSLMEDFKKQVAGDGAVCANRGDVKQALLGAASKFSADYEFPYLAHAPMETMNCTIDFDGTRARIWAGHQLPTLDRNNAAQILGLPFEKVEVNTVYAGGSFGRRGNKNSDYVSEACFLAKEYKKPFKIFYTREDDIKAGYFRPMTVHHVEVGFDNKNGIAAWKHKIVGQSVVADSFLEPVMVKNGVEPTVVGGVADSPYELENFFVDLIRPNPNVTTSWWRSVEHTHTAFVMETMMDDVAYKANKDPLKFRKALLTKSPRHLAVLKLLERKSGWGHAMKKGHALGLAVHESFNSVVGHVAEVSYVNNQVKVHKIVSAVHCGQVVNPEGAKSQVEGAIIYGLSAALHGEIKITKGEITTHNFYDYPVVRMNEAPLIEVYFVPSKDAPTGLGEPGVPPTAPAVANALFKLTGRRIHKLPFTKGLA